MSWLARQLDASFTRRVERDHRETDRAFRRRRVVAATTLAVGATILWFSLSTEPGNPRFYLLTLLLAATWTLGAVLSGPLHAGWIQAGSDLRRPVLQPIAVGLAAVAVFSVGGVLVAQVPLLTGLVNDVLEHVRQGWLPAIAVVTVLNGLAEELFFRGGLYAAIGVRGPVLISTVVYTLATVATGNLMLVLAAAALGLVVGVQRRVSGGVLAPMLTHVTWSLGMLLVLPALITGVG